LLLDIYGAGEKKIEGVSSEKLAEGIKRYGHKHVEYIVCRDETLDHLRKYLDNNSVLLTLGAGDVWKEGEKYLHAEKKVA